MFVRSAGDKFNLANFMRAHLHASVGVLKIGNDILFNEEKIRVDRITGHGGLFKTKGVGQRVLAAAINSPISVMETAGEGGAWGMALLGSYLVNNTKGLSLEDYLEEVVFGGNTGEEVVADLCPGFHYGLQIEFPAVIAADQIAYRHTDSDRAVAIAELAVIIHFKAGTHGVVTNGKCIDHCICLLNIFS